MNRRLRPTAVMLLALLALTACGSRADDALRSRARDAALLSGGSSLGTGGDGSTTGGSTGDAGTTGAGTGRTTGAGGTTGTTSNGTTGTTDPTATTGATGGTTGATTGSFTGSNGGATDVGVTATTLTVGVVADLSGPVPGLFTGAVAGTRAYLAKVNSEGGVFGRQLKLDVGDSQLDCGQFKAETTQAVKKDFAIVGSFSLYDNCGVDPLKTAPSMPDVHSALSNAAQSYASNFSVAPLSKGWRLGPLEYMKKKFGTRFAHIGSIYAAVGGGAESWANCKAAIEHVGGNVDYERAFQPTDTDFTSDIIAMRSSGVQMIYMPATNAGTAANVLKAARAQSVDWPIVFGGPAYDQAFLDAAGAAAEGVYEDQQYSLFFNAGDAQRIPAVAEYQTWMKRTGGKDNMDLFSAYGWASGQLFVQALEAAGPQAKRAAVLAQLKKITRFDAGGLLAPANPAGKQAPTCWLFTQVKNRQWVRVDSPVSAYRCDGGYFHA